MRLSRLRCWTLLAAVTVLFACGPAKTPFNATELTGSAITGKFALKDQHSALRRIEDFAGKLVIVFFGYTQCPDICPTNMSNLRLVMDQLGEESKRVQVLFISVDPARDTPELLGQYVPSFHPDFLGLTGTAEEVAATAKEFRVFYQQRPGATPTTYTVDHSSGSYVFDASGKLRLYLRHGEQPDRITADLRRLLKGE